MNLGFEIKVITKYIDNIISDRNHRYSSWDYCYDAFSVSKNSDILPLHLGFYLASWGMYRGSGGLLQKNHLIHQGAINILTKKDYQSLKCNVSKEINKDSIQLIVKLKKELAEYYKNVRFSRGVTTKPISDTDTLLSKILLGTMACVPAYDRYFIAGLRERKMKFSKFNSSSLSELFDFIEDNNSKILKAQSLIKEKTQRHYPFMKIIDMYFWQIGYDIRSRK